MLNIKFDITTKFTFLMLYFVLLIIFMNTKYTYKFSINNFIKFTIVFICKFIAFSLLNIIIYKKNVAINIILLFHCIILITTNCVFIIFLIRQSILITTPKNSYYHLPCVLIFTIKKYHVYVIVYMIFRGVFLLHSIIFYDIK